MFKKIGLLLVLFLLGITNVKSENNVNLYLFYSETCITCASEEKYLNDIKDDYP